MNITHFVWKMTDVSSDPYLSIRLSWWCVLGCDAIEIATNISSFHVLFFTEHRMVLPIGYSVIVALTGLPIGYSVLVGLPIGYSVIVALTGLPIGHSVIVALTGLPIGYGVIVALTDKLTHLYQSNCSS